MQDALACMVLSPALGNRASAQESKQYEVRIRAYQDALNAAIPAIEQSGLTISADQSEEAKEIVSRTPKERAAPVVLIIIGAIAAINISKMLLELARSYYYGGVVIDARGEKILISNDVKVPAGLVIVIAKDGSKTTFKESDISTEFVNAILSKLK
ncbi:hypothetical protein C7212DRAFT_349016 [Tuber magnatum]|uniref:Uncharacterized protein n=1 Tax=Tuber magnatum TaxID=42249 RepID=A0A317SAG9_9PEZI|nr:hypothetical protein C7212DRAFT_349016 [Tuber magnatum]